jgi:hypothetical protein
LKWKLNVKRFKRFDQKYCDIIWLVKYSCRDNECSHSLSEENYMECPPSTSIFLSAGDFTVEHPQSRRATSWCILRNLFSTRMRWARAWFHVNPWATSSPATFYVSLYLPMLLLTDKKRMGTTQVLSDNVTAPSIRSVCGVWLYTKSRRRTKEASFTSKKIIVFSRHCWQKLNDFISKIAHTNVHVHEIFKFSSMYGKNLAWM